MLITLRAITEMAKMAIFAIMAIIVNIYIYLSISSKLVNVWYGVGWNTWCWTKKKKCRVQLLNNVLYSKVSNFRLPTV